MKTRKIRAEDVIFLLFCIFDIYILPVILTYKDAFADFGKKGFDIAKACSALTGWAGGFGAFILMFGAAVYVFFKNKKQRSGDNTLWTAVFTLLPLEVFALAAVIYGDSSGYGAVMLYIPVIFVCGGIWLGRLIAGKYKGIRQFYAADILYIAACAVLLAASGIFMQNDVLSPIGTAVLLAELFLLSLLYGRFSEFEYIQERAVRAMLVAALVFMGVSFGFAARNFDFSKIFYAEMPQYYYWNGFKGGRQSFLKTYSSFAAAVSVISLTAGIGVAVGYYLRIMRLGGAEESNEEKEKRRKVIFCGITAAVLLLCTVYQARFLAFKRVSLYDLLNAGTAKTIAISLSTDNGENTIYTLSKDGIEKILDTLKNEKAVEVRTLPHKHKTDGYTVTAYSEQGKMFRLEMRQRGEMDISVYEPEIIGYDVILPKQYYGFEPTKINEYADIINSAAEPDTEEKLRFIDADQDNYLIKASVWESFVTDRDVKVRQAAAAKAPSVKLIAKFAADKDEGVKAAAYKLLEERCFNWKREYFVENGIYDLLQELADTEKDEKYRFYAVNCFASAVKKVHYTEWSGKRTVFKDFQGKYLNSSNDIDKLTYACAMLLSGDKKYLDEIREIADRLPDEYGEIKEFIPVIFTRAGYVELKDGSFENTADIDSKLKNYPEYIIGYDD
ncbi:MAG: hypothetical protein IJR59_01030 [Firmicutes bacterium]|nr:hypothetical protein [Bacillota bacterium]